MASLPMLLTCGATRNPLDSMRYISAHSTGKTGTFLASLLQETVEVHVLASPEAALRLDPRASCELFGSTRDLQARMREWVRRHPGGTVVHAAAVGDYEVQTAGGKIPSGQEELILRLQPTPKIADEVTQWDPRCRLFTFKAAPPGTTEQGLLTLCQRQRERTRSLGVFGNILGQLEQTLALVMGDQATVYQDREQALRALAVEIMREAAS